MSEQCPKCGSTNVTKLKDLETMGPNRSLWKCLDCGNEYYVPLSPMGWKQHEKLRRGGGRVIDDFLFFDNDWMKEEFSHLEFVRSEKYLTFKLALNILLQSGGKIIVETGTMRLADDPGGCGTLLFGAFCQKYGGELHTVDNDPKHMATSKQCTAKYKDHITYILSDSVKFLRSCNDIAKVLTYTDDKIENIDLLYLDSMDCPAEGDATQAQEHQLAELKAAWPFIQKPGTVVLMDDNNFPNGGKTRLSKNFLLEQKFWVCLMDHGQSVWLRV